MAVAYAPFDENERPPARQLVPVNKGLPVSDNTECNYVALGFIIGIFLLGVTDALRSK